MLIIDGYNLLWAIHKEADHSELDDLQLCRLIGQYLKLVRRQGQIIFDGKGPPDKAPFERISNLEVIFSGQTKDADAVIEAKIAADSAPRRLTIISSDQGVRKAARAAKAVSMKSESFYSEMVKVLSRKKPQAEPSEKRLGLDPAQTKQWLKYFNLEE
jgi:predicted RNA-binding protein with PIN domain